MQLVDDTLVLSATDLTGHLACPHLTTLAIRRMRGELFIPPGDDPHQELLKRRGDEHEHAFLAELATEHDGDVVTIARPARGLEALQAADDATRAAMERGAPVIFQAAFFDGRWHGRADFLVRTDRPSDLGDWSYEVVDTKLARSLKATHVHQLCGYSLHVERLQGVMPHHAYVKLGDGTLAPVRLNDVMALHRHARRRLVDAIAAERDTYPEPVSHCDFCDFGRHCYKQRVADDHLSLVAGIRRDQRKKLLALELPTVEALAHAPDTHDPGELKAQAFKLLHTQAELQVLTRDTQELQRRHLEPERARGYARLPKPDPADVFFDLEGDPWLGEEGVQYLWGYELDDGEDWEYRALWAHDEDAERIAFEHFVDWIVARRFVHPAMHVYHYSPAEPSALKRLASRLASREAEIDQLLRDGVFVDLYAVVKQGLQVGQRGYSIKDLEPFYMEQRDKTITSAGGSIVAYETWLATGEDEILEEIRAYNEDDCHSTRLLRDWLLTLRAEAATTFEVDFDELARPEPDEPQQDPEWVADVERLAARLFEGLPEDPTADDPHEAEHRLLGHLLLYHRREGKPEWWRFFALCEMGSVDLIGETDAIGGLEPDPEREPYPYKRSTAYPMVFPPQETRLDPGDVTDPVTAKGAGHVIELDPAGRLVLVRGPSFKDKPLPDALIGPSPIPTKAQREALTRLAEAVLDEPDTFRAARSILRRELPSALDALALRDSHLVVQGPPGTGKTYRGARMIVTALERGDRVGVSAFSHKAIHNLLAEVEKVAVERGVDLRGFHKNSGGDSEYESAHQLIETSDSNDGATDPELNLVAGTPWLFARAALDDTLDLLFIDEAGQMSIADAVASATSARSVVLLGDPQQLPQVTQGSHPGTSGRSALEHLLDGAETVPPERGLFLTETWRMHPAVCAYISETFYEGRLEPLPGLERRRVDAGGPLSGAGLRHLAVEHDGNAQASPEEAALIAARCRELLAGGRVTEPDGETRDLEAKDILVVAPYNLAVRCIQATVPRGVRVGTVDKFQGQEAPVVFYAMATSTGEDAPRGLDFLFNPNRLNVAISRAQCLAILVASPRLLDAECRTLEQMRMVSNVCELAERAVS